MENHLQSLAGNQVSHHELELPDNGSISNKVEQLAESITNNVEHSVESWKAFETQLEDLGFVERNPEQYLSSVAQLHGSEVLVRRANFGPVFTSLEKKEPLYVKRLDTEPNAALLGVSKRSQNGVEVSGIEAALAGGFGWLIENKVAGVYGFVSDHSNVKVSDLVKDSPSLAKKYAEVMKGIEGSIAPEDILFVLFRIHKSAYPEALCLDEDFDDLTGDRKPFQIRLYAKNRQTH
ncbi:MAG: hypothetical protein KBC21_03295 [Candidatus Pacebacteria bacterium]|nr:hypothetical protein [Candidatus Paceibacterota bacterium]